MTSSISALVEPKTTHIERTSKEPRQDILHTVVLSRIEQVNRNVRLFRLSIPKGQPSIKFKPGQWLDFHIPDIPKPGGFTICSPPSLAAATSTPKDGRYLELAIKSSPGNPAAAFLFRPISEIENTELKVRVGGSFVWPPRLYTKDKGEDDGGGHRENHRTPDPSSDSSQTPDLKQKNRLKRVVFIASGMGVNPLISMLSHIAETETQTETKTSQAPTNSPSVPESNLEITFLYGVREEPEPEPQENGLNPQSQPPIQDPIPRPPPKVNNPPEHTLKQQNHRFITTIPHPSISLIFHKQPIITSTSTITITSRRSQHNPTHHPQTQNHNDRRPIRPRTTRPEKGHSVLHLRRAEHDG
ncbi:hypothetical protein B7463_g8283, partial [Scytalidium lignicola]